MKTLYLDIFSGVSGDMFIGALLDLGVPFNALESELRKLDLGDFHMHATRKHKASIEGVKFDVHEHAHDHDHSHLHEIKHSPVHKGGAAAKQHEYDYEQEEEDAHDQAHGQHRHEDGHGHSHSHTHTHEHEHEHGRTFGEIRAMIQGSALSFWVKEKAVSVFARIARAEGKIHGQPADEVHFHEVGAVDSIVDIVGGCVALELLGKPRVLAATVIEGTGFIRCAHGRFPIPAPATLAILAERNVPVTQCEEPQELVTPTGAALLAEFVEEFGPMRNFSPEVIGYGLGERDNRTRPNVLRALLGRSIENTSSNDWESDTIAVLETNLDDINSEILGYVVERALAEGALDAFHTAIQMKKNRPGVMLTILCANQDQDRFTELLLRETTAFGIRRSISERRKLKREVVKLNTPFGEIEVKLGKLGGRNIQIAPEFESCRRIAQEQSVPIKDVYAAALRAGLSLAK